MFMVGLMLDTGSKCSYVSPTLSDTEDIVTDTEERYVKFLVRYD